MSFPEKKPDRASSRLNMFDLYGAMVLIYFALRYTVGDSLPFVAFCANCIPLALLPAVIVLPVALRKRKRFMTLWGSLATTFLILEFGPRFMLTLRRAPSATIPTLRVLSHNTGQDLPDYAGRDQLIRGSQADIIVLQEVTRGLH